MKKLLSLLLCAIPLMTASCGYKMGGLVNGSMHGLKTFDVAMFENHTVYPYAAVQMTSALADVMQSDGTFRMAAPSASDFCISGKVKSVRNRSLMTNPDDSYISSEIAVEVYVDYVVTNRKTGEVVKSGEARGEWGYFNTSGNAQSARETALSYAVRLAAQEVLNQLTLP